MWRKRDECNDRNNPVSPHTWPSRTTPSLEGRRLTHHEQLPSPQTPHNPLLGPAAGTNGAVFSCLVWPLLLVISVWNRRIHPVTTDRHQNLRIHKYTFIYVHKGIDEHRHTFTCTLVYNVIHEQMRLNVHMLLCVQGSIISSTKRRSRACSFR